MHKTSFDHVEEFSKTLGEGLNVLDVGSFNVNGSYKDLFVKQNYQGCDIVEGHNVDIVMPEPYKIPLEDESVDVMVSGNTFEHVEMPWNLVLEMDRLLKVGGFICMTVPHTFQEHKYPIDCWRMYPDGLEVLFGKWMEENGRKKYEIIKNETMLGDTLFTAKKV